MNNPLAMKNNKLTNIYLNINVNKYIHFYLYFYLSVESIDE